MKVLKKGSRFTRAAAVVLVAVILLSGCGLFKPKVISLTGNMVKKVGKVNSAEVTTNLQSEFEIIHESVNVGVNGNLDTTTVTEMTKDPARSKQDSTWTIEGLGKKLDIETEQYTDKAENGDMIVYVRQKGGKWSKKTISASGGSQDEGSQENTETNGVGQVGTFISGSLGQGTSIQNIEEMIEVLSDSIENAELKKELVTINDQECYQINLNLGGNTLLALLKMSGVDLSSIGFDADSVDLDGIEVPSELYIYKKSGLPARIKADCADLADRVIGDKMTEKLEGTLLSGIKLDFRTFLLDMTFDRYDEISPIEIPAEALSAEEGVSLENYFYTFLDLFF